MMRIVFGVVQIFCVWTLSFFSIPSCKGLSVSSSQNVNQAPMVHSDRGPLLPSSDAKPAYIDSSYLVPRVNYSALALADDDGTTPPPEGMVLYPLHVSGKREERVNLMFFSDGYSLEEEDKFVNDAKTLTDDIISSKGAMGHVAHLLNVWAVFVASNQSGIGTHDTAIPGAAFGLYRPGPELRAVFVQHPKRARAACRSFRDDLNSVAGCDQPILLGNDPLYGGLGGEFTIITASEMNGPLVLRHELGHSLIPVGEEYEGGYAYFGANSDKVQHIDRLKWRQYLTEPEGVRIEDAKVPLQVYPWHDLDDAPYNITFTSSDAIRSPVPNHDETKDYPKALLRASLSSIPFPEHISIVLNDRPLDLSQTFSDSWNASMDRRWLEVDLPRGLERGLNEVRVELTEEGKKARAGQGGKMITSLEIVEYGGGGRFNHSDGFVGAFPTYAMDGSVTLRPTNEGCLMRKVNHPTFCPICAQALQESLEGRIALREEHRPDPV